VGPDKARVNRAKRGADKGKTYPLTAKLHNFSFQPPNGWLCGPALKDSLGLMFLFAGMVGGPYGL